MTASRPRLVLTDIEGTTSSIQFVHDVLFPYAREHLPTFVRRHADDLAVRTELDAVRMQTGATDDEAVITILLDWIAADRKATALKNLQGLVWESGYKSGAFRAHLYPDAARALQAWHEAGIPLAVYSSGSIAAQKLFFAHSEAGDLCSLFGDFFDTSIGPKREARSYLEISQAMERSPAGVVFLSDVVAELDAARDAGLATVLIDRTEDYPEPRTGDATHGHTRLTAFPVEPDFPKPPKASGDAGRLS